MEPRAEQSTPKEWLLAERMMIPAGWLGSRQLFEAFNPGMNRSSSTKTESISRVPSVASDGVIFEPQSRVYYRSEMQGSVSQFKPHKAPSLFASIESFEQTVLQLGNDSAIKT